MDIAAWLQGLGLEKYKPAFRANAIDARVLHSLTVEDLKDLGLTLVGIAGGCSMPLPRSGPRGPPLL